MKTQTKTKTNKQHARSTKAEIVEAELERVLSARGELTKEIVLEEATAEDSPLHAYFEWDDEAAAHKHRLDQAYRLIQGSTYVIFLNKQPEAPPEPHSVRTFIPSTKDEGFKFRKNVLGQRDERASFVARKRRELDGWCASTVDIAELQPLRNAILARLAGDTN